jgi:hypothetical protein
VLRQAAPRETHLEEVYKRPPKRTDIEESRVKLTQTPIVNPPDSEVLVQKPKVSEQLALRKPETETTLPALEIRTPLIV